MSEKVFSSNKTTGEVAYELALALASRDSEVTSPELLLEKIAQLLPSCLIAAEQRWSKENPPLSSNPGFLL